MSFRQAVIQLGSWTVKAGLWEQTFLPTTELAACVQLETNKEDGTVKERRYGEHFTTDALYPIVKGQLVNIEELEHLLRHVLLSCLQLTEPLSDVPVLLIVPSCWPRSTRLVLLKMMLQRIGVAGVYFGEATLMAAFGCATPTSLVIDIGHSLTEIAAFVEGEFNTLACRSIALGTESADAFLQNLIKDQLVEAGITTKAEQLQIARKIKESNICHPSSSTNELFEYENGKNLSLGPERMNLFNDFINPISNGDCLDILEAVRLVIRNCEAEHRQIIFDHIIITGCSSRNPLLIKSVSSKLETLLAISGNASDNQPRTRGLNKPVIEAKTAPTYYPEIWQKATPLAAWFGGGIVAKCVLGDSKNYITREDLFQCPTEKVLDLKQ